MATGVLPVQQASVEDWKSRPSPLALRRVPQFDVSKHEQVSTVCSSQMQGKGGKTQPIPRDMCRNLCVAVQNVTDCSFIPPHRRTAWTAARALVHQDEVMPIRPASPADLVDQPDDLKDLVDSEGFFGKSAANSSNQAGLLVALMSLFDSDGNRTLTRDEWMGGNEALELETSESEWQALLKRFHGLSTGVVDLRRPWRCLARSSRSKASSRRSCVAL